MLPGLLRVAVSRTASSYLRQLRPLPLAQLRTVVVGPVFTTRQASTKKAMEVSVSVDAYIAAVLGGTEYAAAS